MINAAANGEVKGKGVKEGGKEQKMRGWVCCKRLLLQEWMDGRD